MIKPYTRQNLESDDFETLAHLLRIDAQDGFT